ncbi:hypothetical protein LTR84_009734 [Exophiala bonariae]|uniref:Xylanolytic transcriptional activator regulatory domain-containing protein n=1 Tax=Exophiala bonariae TaxID=1690606 RepID=A0AAV9NMU9_9EURO|nr:hypothetical protein LTR84_009734 [Exophiala bonariae]
MLLRAVLSPDTDYSQTQEADPSNTNEMDPLCERYMRKVLMGINTPRVNQIKARQPLARLVEHGDSDYTFLGDSSASALLQTVRQLAITAIGDCAFINLQENFSQGPPVDERQPKIIPGEFVAPPKPDIVEARRLVRWYLYSTACFGDLFDESLLMGELSAWLSDPQERHDWISSKFFFILAVGAQTCPEDKDRLAQSYYTYGRNLTVCDTMEHTSAGLVGAQCYTLITLYLMNASRLNAAFMNLGQAIRAAYGLGLHRTDLVADFSPSERRTRDRLWKAIRVFDVYLSATLGRPLATHESRNTTTATNYSPTVDMCTIYESVLTEVYTQPTIGTEMLQQIIDHNRAWATRFPAGIENDGVDTSEQIQLGCHLLPNIGLFHLKQAFYGVTILLTHRYIGGSVLSDMDSSVGASNPNLDQNVISPWLSSSQLLGLACVQSAIDSIELFRELLVADQVPKRLPLVVNSVFYAALVLGSATFSDLYPTFSLQEYLETACNLLSIFRKHDWLAMQYTGISERLSAACKEYVEKKSRSQFKNRRALISELFGDVDIHQPTESIEPVRDPDSREHRGPAPSHRERFTQECSPASIPSNTLHPAGSEMGTATMDSLDFAEFLEDSFLPNAQSHFLQTPFTPFCDLPEAAPRSGPCSDSNLSGLFVNHAFQSKSVDASHG